MLQAETAAFAAIQAYGLRLTAARRELVATMAVLPEPATIQEIAAKTAVDDATVYRNITPLLSAGVLEEINTAGSPVKYALAHGHHHDHLICTSCGRIVHVPCTVAPATSLIHKEFANITHHAVTYYGLCKRCASIASSLRCS